MIIRNWIAAASVGLLLACTPAAQDAANTDSAAGGGTTSDTSAAVGSNTDTTSSTLSNPYPASDVAATASTTQTQEKPMSEYTNKIVEMKTSAGTITLRFFPDVAPNHVRNFIDLAQQGFYTGTKFHRVIPGFMIQGGDPNTKTGAPNTWGTGGSEKNLKAEFSQISHKRGILSMARSQDPNSASSQFFVVVKDSPFLDRQYTVFGEVVSGMDVADKIVNAPRGAQDRPNDPVSIVSMTVREATAEEKK